MFILGISALVLKSQVESLNSYEDEFLNCLKTLVKCLSHPGWASLSTEYKQSPSFKRGM